MNDARLVVDIVVGTTFFSPQIHDGTINGRRMQCRHIIAFTCNALIIGCVPTMHRTTSRSMRALQQQLAPAAVASLPRNPWHLARTGPAAPIHCLGTSAHQALHESE